MTATAKTTRKTVAQLLAEHAQDLLPVDGDKAYTFYHGKVWIGVLKQTPIVNGFGGGWIIVPPNGQKLFEGGDMPYLPRNYRGMEDVPLWMFTVPLPAPPITKTIGTRASRRWDTKRPIEWSPTTSPGVYSTSVPARTKEYPLL